MFDLLAFARECRVPEAENFVRRLEELRCFLVEANAKVNLTRIVEPEDFAVKHAADSLAVVRFFPELAEKALDVADVGCGAGFPSLVLALAFPALRICAIDSSGKKTAFVAAAKEKFDLANIEVVQGRSVELNRKPVFRNRFDVVTARAVAAADQLYAGTSHFVRPGGQYIFYKTPLQADSEREALRQTGIAWRATSAFELSSASGSRLFVHARTPAAGKGKKTFEKK